MKGKFTVRIGTELHTYDDTDKIPEKFDYIISFMPEYPPVPHTDEEHEQMGAFMDVLKELQKRERRFA